MQRAARWMLLAAASVAVGCRPPRTVGRVRFVNRPPVWVVNDREHVAKRPQELKQLVLLDHLDAVIFQRIPYLLAMHPRLRARAVNSVDDVPDSTWFTNRIGRRALRPAALARGPNRLPPADQRLPLTVLSTKVGGGSVGFIVADNSGVRYLLKFDTKGAPERETGADVIVQRILWACGYNVPEDDVIHLRAEDLKLAANAKIKDVFGKPRPMTQRDLDVALGKIDVGGDGRIRALASRFLSGKLLGGFPMLGVREGDPNDRVPHQHRRDVRGQRALFAWLNHNDVKEDNTLDMYVRDPADPARKYVVHYLIDFGQAIGTRGAARRRDVGFARYEDLQWALPSLLSLGIWVRPWERLERPAIHGVGLWSAASYHPDSWEPSKDYWPFHEADRFDGFWAAKLIARFSPAHLEQAVRAARYSDAAAIAKIVEVLRQRARLTIAPYFERVSPLDGFRVADGERLCFSDLAIEHGYAAAEKTRYALRAYDERARELPAPQLAASAARGRGQRCVSPLPRSPSADGYLIVQVVAQRDSKALPPLDVHLARAPKDGRLRVIGLWRH
ncbi:MAG: hypothetical protein KC503_43250 [Myxococcales bacterium]|nr:hypothetical protein [Myxococcales bacterium]